MIARIVNAAATTLGIVAAVAIALLGITVLIDVTGRNVFNAPVSGALEVVQYWWMTALVWLGVGYAQQVDEHLRVTLLPGGMGKRGAAILTGIANLGGLACALVLLPPTWTNAIDAMQIQQAVVSSVAVPIWPFTFLVPLGLMVLAAQCVIQAVGNARTALTKEVDLDVD